MTNKLVAVRPNATVDHEIDGVIFKIGIVPQNIHAKWVEVVRRKDFKGDLYFNACNDVVRWAIKGHENFLYDDGEEVPFGQKKSVVGGKTTMIVDDATMEIYYSSKVIQDLSTRIMGGEEIKLEDGSSSD